MVIFAHSTLRWLFLSLALVTLVVSVRAYRTGLPWSRVHDRLSTALFGVARIQVLVGLALLLWASPVGTIAWQLGPRLSFKTPVLAWFGFVHPGLMITAIAVLEVGIARMRRLDVAEAKHRTLSITVAVCLGVVLVAVPWPGLPWGRPLMP